jgi:hypothetical protein
MHHCCYGHWVYVEAYHHVWHCYRIVCISIVQPKWISILCIVAMENLNGPKSLPLYNNNVVRFWKLIINIFINYFSSYHYRWLIRKVVSYNLWGLEKMRGIDYWRRFNRKWLWVMPISWCYQTIGKFMNETWWLLYPCSLRSHGNLYYKIELELGVGCACVGTIL